MAEQELNTGAETKTKPRAKPRKPREQNDRAIHATISSYHDYGSYVWVDYGDGEDLARSLEQAGSKVIRVYGTNRLTRN